MCICRWNIFCPIFPAASSSLPASCPQKSESPLSVAPLLQYYVLGNLLVSCDYFSSLCPHSPKTLVSWLISEPLTFSLLVVVLQYQNNHNETHSNMSPALHVDVKRLAAEEIKLDHHALSLLLINSDDSFIAGRKCVAPSTAPF